MVWICEIPVHVSYVAALLQQTAVPPAAGGSAALRTPAPNAAVRESRDGVEGGPSEGKQYAHRLRSAHAVLEKVYGKIKEVETLVARRGMLAAAPAERVAVALLRPSPTVCGDVVKVSAVCTRASEADVIAVSSAALDEPTCAALYYTALEQAHLFQTAVGQSGSGPPSLVPRALAEVEPLSQGPLDLLFKKASQRTPRVASTKETPAPSSSVYVCVDDVEIIE
ncbi:hypothetical protein STCU_10363 [Strigomonas culicis]|uniref:Uncharacterized protein n=1 Tax=Strigomonas culicis TaxID=28005 RepID=S9TIB9_9TRYP|nr:hypothetical protein STCU_10363 [Strigomonas culicis]|eukprot:EPY17847.1 hypothetical protein STCU_10363 [Strigomonas culicis]